MSKKVNVTSKEYLKEKSLETAKTVDKTTIVNQFAQTKMSLIDILDSLTNKLITGSELLNEVDIAIMAKKEILKEVHDIEVESDTLSKLVAAQEETRKQWKREQEEYEYELKKARDIEAYQWKLVVEASQRELKEEISEAKSKLEAEKQAFESQMQELLDLRTQASEFPAKLSEAIIAKEKEVSKSLHGEFNYKSMCAQKDSEAEIALLKQTNSTLEKRIEELEAALQEARNLQKDAVERVQSIAEKAIEGASKHQTLVMSNGDMVGNLKK